MGDFDILGYAAGGMQAEHAALDVAARNIALAQTAGKDHPVHPLAAVFASTLSSFDDDLPGEPIPDDPEALAVRDDDDEDTGDDPGLVGDPATLPGAIRFAGTRERGPAQTGIDAVTEMVNVLDAQRAYEFNASVFDAGKKLITQTIQMGQT